MWLIELTDGVSWEQVQEGCSPSEYQVYHMQDPVCKIRWVYRDSIGSGFSLRSSPGTALEYNYEILRFMEKSIGICSNIEIGDGSLV